MYHSVEGTEGFGLRDPVPDPDSDSMVEKAASMSLETAGRKAEDRCVGR